MTLKTKNNLRLLARAPSFLALLASKNSLRFKVYSLGPGISTFLRIKCKKKGREGLGVGAYVPLQGYAGDFLSGCKVWLEGCKDMFGS